MKEIKEILEHSKAKKQWKEFGIKHHHGIDLPLFSIRSKNSCGIGEFYDLIPLINWCQSVHLNIIQLLPINDSGNDPSPYNALSSCALNPLYLSLHALPYVKESSELKKKLQHFTYLNEHPRVIYGDVHSHKLDYLRLYFDLFEKKILASPEFIDFTNNNLWVEPYALFKSLKEKLDQNNSLSWPKELKSPSKKEYKLLTEKYKREISFYTLLQYLCFIQAKEIKNYARQRGVFIKGDIPILISPDSADVWHEPSLFNLNLAAGAPPDTYNTEGQHWGFPLFNWDEMEKNHYKWWKTRLSYASNFYDLYRIDHVAGFFRIWGISHGDIAKNGKFYPELKDLWIPQGRRLLEMMLDSCSMLPIAEDLGAIGKELRSCLKELGICGTKVMRWERRWDGDQQFIPFSDYPPISMTCVSTHDSETLFQWWKNNPEEAKAFASFKNWSYNSELSRKEREEILKDSHHSASLFHINLFQEYLACFPELVCQIPEDERINVPGKVLSTNWTYRFKHSIEEIITHQGLQEMVINLLDIKL